MDSTVLQASAVLHLAFLNIHKELCNINILDGLQEHLNTGSSPPRLSPKVPACSHLCNALGHFNNCPGIYLVVLLPHCMGAWGVITPPQLLLACTNSVCFTLKEAKTGKGRCRKGLMHGNELTGTSPTLPSPRPGSLLLNGE